jgi:antitoxin PrlF
MNDLIVDSNGEATIPKVILEAIGLLPGDRVRFTLLADGSVIMRAKHKSLDAAAGILHREGLPLVAVDQMSPWE